MITLIALFAIIFSYLCNACYFPLKSFSILSLVIIIGDIEHIIHKLSVNFLIVVQKSKIYIFHSYAIIDQI